MVGFSCALHMSHKDHDEATEHHNHGRLNSNHPKNSNSSANYIGRDEPCCQGAVNNFVSLAKLVPQSGKVIIRVPLIFIGSYYQLPLITSPGVITRRQISVDERQRPPTPDIRIVIQSFQI